MRDKLKIGCFLEKKVTSKNGKNRGLLRKDRCGTTLGGRSLITHSFVLVSLYR